MFKVEFSSFYSDMNFRICSWVLLHAFQFIITAGEDCTCRVWGSDGKQLKMIKEHM